MVTKNTSLHIYVLRSIYKIVSVCRQARIKLVNETSQSLGRHSVQTQAINKQKSWLMVDLMHVWSKAFGHKRLCYKRATDETLILSLLYSLQMINMKQMCFLNYLMLKILCNKRNRMLYIFSRKSSSSLYRRKLNIPFDGMAPCSFIISESFCSVYKQA